MSIQFYTRPFWVWKPRYANYLGIKFLTINLGKWSWVAMWGGREP